MGFILVGSKGHSAPSSMFIMLPNKNVVRFLKLVGLDDAVFNLVNSVATKLVSP